MLEVEGEREEKEEKKRNSKKKGNKIEYLNKMGKKIEFWDVEYIVKWYGIIDKVTFWHRKIRWNTILGCECSYI